MSSKYKGCYNDFRGNHYGLSGQSVDIEAEERKLREDAENHNKQIAAIHHEKEKRYEKVIENLITAIGHYVKIRNDVIKNQVYTLCEQNLDIRNIIESYYNPTKYPEVIKLIEYYMNYYKNTH